MSREELEDFMLRVATVLYGGEDGWDPEQEWDSGTIEFVAEEIPHKLTQAIAREYTQRTGRRPPFDRQ
jgi:protein-L-isoaspartate O-methyltransferase